MSYALVLLSFEEALEVGESSFHIPLHFYSEMSAVSTP